MTFIRTALPILLAAALPLQAAKEETPFPKDLPAYGPERAIPALATTQRILPNGLGVWVVRRQGLPKVAAYLALRGGTAADAPGKEGLSGFMADLLTEGTVTRSAKQIAETLQAIGGDLGGRATPDAVFLSGASLSSGLPTLLNLLADVARNPAFPDKEVELAKANTLMGLKAQEAQPSFQANRAFSGVVYGNHPYRFTAMRPEVLEAANPAALKALHAERFQPGRALLILCGDLQEEAALKLAAAAFGDWKGTGAGPGPTPEAPGTSPRGLYLVPREGSVQSALLVGRPTVPATHPDHIPLQLANIILGGGAGSRIFKNIREDKGYTYSPGSRARGLQAGGNHAIRADVRTDVTAASLMEIFYEMDRMGTTRVGDAELLSAKRYMGGMFLFQNQMLGALTGSLATNWVNGLGPAALSEFIPKVNAVTADEVRRISRTYYASKDQTVVVVGDGDQAKAEVEQFGPVKVLKP